MESVTDLVNGNPDTGFSATFALMGRFFHADNVSLTKIGSVEGQYSIVAQWPDSRFDKNLLNPWCHHSLLAGSTVMQGHFGHNTPGDFFVVEEETLPQNTSFIRIPIYLSGKVSHCLGLDWERRPGKMNFADLLQILEPAARLIQSVLQSRQVNNIVHNLARHDHLTGLVNRSVVLDFLDKAMARARSNNDVVAILHLNIDQLKTINDALGYLNGDYLLKAVAKRLVDIINETDTVACFGAGNFVILLENLVSGDCVKKSLQRIKMEFEAPIFIGGQNIHVELSQGVAMYNQGTGDAAEGLLRNAESAMEHAKDEGGNQVQFYVPKMNTAKKKNLNLEHDLQLALNRGEFELHFQPQLCLESGLITGAEALIRWPHPEFGMLPPSEFLWIAEETGLIVPLSEWILGEACTAALHWHSNVLRNFQVAVNVSPRWFSYPGFPETVKNVLDHVGLPPGCLELEITEDVVLSNTETTGPLLAHLRSMGVKITLDDFGTGYSSFSYLRNIPVTALKIDRSFVSYLETQKTDEAIVLALITLCKELKIETVAEGVETAEQLAFLREHDCHLAQGYHIARPENRQALNDRIKPKGNVPHSLKVRRNKASLDAIAGSRERLWMCGC